MWFSSFSAATRITRTRLNFALNVCGLSCYFAIFVNPVVFFKVLLSSVWGGRLTPRIQLLFKSQVSNLTPEDASKIKPLLSRTTSAIPSASSLSKRDSDEVNRWRHSTLSPGRNGCTWEVKAGRREWKSISSLCTDKTELTQDKWRLSGRSPTFRSRRDWRRKEGCQRSCVHLLVESATKCTKWRSNQISLFQEHLSAFFL